MGLKIKTFKTILNDMATWISTRNPSLNNFYVGSVIRTLLEAISIEIESMYYQMYKGFRFSIENSIFHSFGFYKSEAIASSGEVLIIFRMPLPQDIVLLSGYKFSTLPYSGDPVYFVLDQDTVIVEGSTNALVKVTCTQTDVIGNVPRYAIRVCTTPLSYIQEVYNPQAFTNGRAEETKEERKKRFTKYIETLARGTVSAIEYGCLKVPGVTGAHIDDSPGKILVYAHDSSGNLPNELKELILQSLVDYRPAGIELTVLSVTKVPVDITIHATLQDGYDSNIYQSSIRDSVVSFLNYYTVNTALTKAELINFLMSIEAVSNVYTSLEEDIPVGVNELIRAGTITVIIE